VARLQGQRLPSPGDDRDAAGGSHQRKSELKNKNKNIFTFKNDSFVCFINIKKVI